MALPALTACNKEEQEDFSFEIQNAEGTQAFVFGETREFPFTAVNVSRSSFEKPEGWEARLDFSSKVLKITAPSGEGAESGTVVVKVYSDSGAEKTAQVNVSATEAKIEFSVDGIADGLSLKYGESVELKAQMSNVASVEPSGAKGWKSEKVSDTAVKVTAPSKTDEGADLEGTLVLTPKSGRGSAGNPVSVMVSVKIAEPSVQFDKTSVGPLSYGEAATVKTTELTNVSNFELKSAPKGWTAVVDLSATSASISITAPAKGSEFEGMGDIVFLATSETDATCEVVVKACMFGINSKEDFVNFATTYAKAFDDASRDMSPYTLGDEYVLNCDIDLSDTKYSTCIIKGHDFSEVFNGNGHTIKYALENEGGSLALFDTVNGTVKNLTVDGTITYGGDGKAGGITLWSDAGRYENIIVKVAYTQTGAYAGSAGNFGGIAAAETSPAKGAVYTDCHFRGSMTAQSVKYLGGMIGDVWDNSPNAVFTNCTNEGNIVVNSEGVRIQDICHGGLVGNCRGACPKFVNCYNTGNMSYDFGGAKGDAEAIGGLVGYATGVFENCYNTGNITFSDKNVVRGWAHVGGLIGQANHAKDWDKLEVKKCYNKANVTAYGEDVATFIGIIQSFNAGEVVISDCYSEGVASSVFSKSTDNIAGFIANINDFGTIENCRFTGTTKGYSCETAAMLLANSGWRNANSNAITISGCTVEGNLYIGCHVDEDTSTRPLVGGIACVRGPKLTITGTTAAGNICTMASEKCVDKVFASARIADGTPDEESSTADKTTTDSVSKNTITFVAKSDTFPSDWK